MSVLICENIKKSESNNELIKNFSYNFLDNQIYGIVGKEDSNLNYLFNVISGNLEPNEGKIYIDGEDLYEMKDMRERICYLTQDVPFSPNLTILKIFKLMEEKYPKWDNSYAYELIRSFNIDIKSQYSKLSASKKSLFLGILGLASKANITILKDPVQNADIKDKYDFFNLLYKDHESYPRIFILSTDFIDDISFMLDKILFFDKGRLFAQFTMEDIHENFRFLTGKTEVLRSLMNGVKVIGYEERGKTLTVCVRQKLSKDEIRKYQKYMIKIDEAPIHNIFIYLINLREIKVKF